MASQFSRSKSWRVVTPLVAIAALGLTACSNNEEPTDVPGTTPPVWTGAPAPAGEHGESGSEHATTTGSADNVSVTLKDAKGSQVGTATLAAGKKRSRRSAEGISDRTGHVFSL